jgi:polysaccharide pyruvyl transferase WcaK-like protein
VTQVLLAGAFGQRNPGDEALLRAFIRQLPGRDLVATSDRPAATEAEHGIAAVPRADRRAIGRAVQEADAVVFAGGTVFKLLHPSAGRRPLSLLAQGMAVATAAKTLRRPLALVGVGAGRLPRRRARVLASAIVRSADLCVLRDEDSATLLAEAGAPAPLRVGADAAWACLDVPESPVRRGDAVIVALSHHAGGASLALRLARVLSPLAMLGLRLRLQPWQVTGGRHDDLALARAVAARLDGRAEIVPPPTGLDDACTLFAGARLVVALRFHALMAAGATGVPAVAIAHEPKLAAMARRLGQPAIAPEGDPADLARAMLHAAEHALPPSTAAVALERTRAEHGMRLLRLLLDGGRGADAADVEGLELLPQGWIA